MPNTLRKRTIMNYNEERKKETEMRKNMKLIDKNFKEPMINMLKDLQKKGTMSREMGGTKTIKDI